MTARLVPASTLRVHTKTTQWQALRRRNLELQARRQARWRDDPNGWVETQLGEHLWSGQRKIMAAVVTHRRTAVKSAHDLGKSYSASRLACQWLSTHPPGEAFVVSTAPTYSQVRSILWREIGRAHRKGGLVGRVTQTEWKIDGELVGFGRKPANPSEGGDEQTVTAMQGIHARFVLVIIDEAAGVPKPLWEAADTLITNEHSRILAVGNPDDPTSEFAEVCKPGSGWHVIRLDGLQSPNFTGEVVPDELRHLLLSRTWVEEKRAKWGEDSPLWLSKVRAEFPEHALDTVVIPLAFARRCQVERAYRTTRGLPDMIDPNLVPVELGVDVGDGGDPSVIRERRGIKAGRVWVDYTPDSMTVVNKVVHAIRETGATAVKVDTIGVGTGVASRLEELRRHGKHAATVVRVNVAESPADRARFFTLRDELWWTAREACQDGAWDLCGIDDDTLAELLAPRYQPGTLGRVKVEAKDEIRKRLGRSTDQADALLLAYARPPRRRDRLMRTWAA